MKLTLESALAKLMKFEITLEDVPEEIKTTKFWFEEVRRNGKLLEYVPQELKTVVYRMYPNRAIKNQQTVK